MWLRFGVAMAMAQASGAALICPLAWELPYTTSATVKKKRKRKRNEDKTKLKINKQIRALQSKEK